MLMLVNWGFKGKTWIALFVNLCQLFLKGNTHENNKLEILRRNWKGRRLYIERLGEMDPSDSHLAEAKELLWEVKCVGQCRVWSTCRTWCQPQYPKEGGNLGKRTPAMQQVWYLCRSESVSDAMWLGYKCQFLGTCALWNLCKTDMVPTRRWLTLIGAWGSIYSFGDWLEDCTGCSLCSSSFALVPLFELQELHCPDVWQRGGQRTPGT